MFTVYNNGSVGFRSTVDNLYELKNVEKLSEVRHHPDEGFIASFDEQLNKEKKKQKQALNSYKEMSNIDTSHRVYEVKDIMTSPCISIQKSVTLRQTYESLKDKDIAQMPVVDSNTKIIGLINKKIILNLIMDDISLTSIVLEKKIDDIYLPELITSHPNTDIRAVAKIMLDFKLDAIPIVDDEAILLGIVSKTDIIKAISTFPHLQLWG